MMGLISKRGTYGKHGALVVALCLLAACARNPFSPSEGHLPPSDPKVAKMEEIPPLVDSTTLLSPPKPQEKEELYTVVVHDVPVRDLLFSLSRDAKLNVDIHPSISGIVSINAVEQPLTQILDRIATQVSLRYELKNGILSLQPDTPFWKAYKINFPSYERKAESELSTKLEVGTAQGGTGGGGSGSSSAKVSTKAENEFWKPLVTGIMNIIEADRERGSEEKAAAKAAADAAGVVVPDTSAADKDKTKSASSASSGTLGSREVVVHQASGIINVYATSRQHDQIQSYTDKILVNSQRQVMIEATVVEIVLSDDYQAGVDWSRLTGGGVGNSGTSVRQVSPALADNPVSPDNIFSFTHVVNLSKGEFLNATMRALKKFGDVRVHSSPKIMAINNQMALLKVADEQVYFELEYTSEVRNETTGIVTTPAKTTYTIKTVPIGLLMSVTPQISSDGTIMMTIRPSLTDVREWKKSPSGYITVNNNAVLVEGSDVPVVNIREMESSLRVGDGQTIILGGLMKNDVRDTQTGVPVLSEVPVLGNLFKYKRLNSNKTEMAVFLRPTIINDDQMMQQVKKYEYLLKNETPVNTLPKAVEKAFTGADAKD